MQTAFQNAKTSVSDIQKVQIFPGKHAPGPPTLLCIKKQFYLTNMQKSITAYQSNVSLKKNNKLSLSFFFFVLPLFFMRGMRGGGGGSPPPHTSINLGYKGGPPSKISYEEGGHHILHGLPVEYHQSPSPIKNDRFVKSRFV